MRKSDTYGAQLICEQSPLDLSLMTEKQTTVKQLSAPISQDARSKKRKFFTRMRPILFSLLFTIYLLEHVKE